MTDLGPLFEGATAPYAPGSRSSRDGARSAEPVLGTQLADALAVYRARGPVTDREVSEATGIPLHLVPARRRELQERGLVTVEPVGRKKSPTGVRVNLYDATTTGTGSARG